MTDDVLLAAWFRALESPFGALFETTDVIGARSRLYAARSHAADPRLSALTIRPDPSAPNNRFFILRSAK